MKLPWAEAHSRFTLLFERLAIGRWRARPWPEPAAKGDTVWMGAADSNGCVVSYIQSVYWEFGSGMVLQDTGINWQNRGASFTLDPASHVVIGPRRKPFHTLIPAHARLPDGRGMVYGNMGGDGQPQSQAAVFSRYAMFGQDLQQAVTAPRWLLGRTWGQMSVSLKVESRFDPATARCAARRLPLSPRSAGCATRSCSVQVTRKNSASA